MASPPHLMAVNSSEQNDLAILLKLAKEGSKDEIGRLLSGYRQYLLLIANEELDRELSAKAGASDLVQETLLHAQDQFHGFHGSNEAQLKAWLRTILLNCLGTFRRQFVTAEKRCVAREVSLDEDSLQGIRDRLTTDEKTPSSHAAFQEGTMTVRRAIHRLPRRYRRVIRLRHQDQFSFEEIAEHVGITVPAARQLWARAIKRLQKELGTGHFQL